ncbi:hypothetical protein P5V15_000321 [Pogonomyrmex californicus]
MIVRPFATPWISFVTSCPVDSTGDDCRWNRLETFPLVIYVIGCQFLLKLLILTTIATRQTPRKRKFDWQSNHSPPSPGSLHKCRKDSTRNDSDCYHRMEKREGRMRSDPYWHKVHLTFSNEVTFKSRFDD